MKEQAKQIANLGWAVFPCNGKRAICKWRERSTSDKDTVEAMFRKHANIGVDCGKSGLIAIDLDVKGDKDGLSDWETLKQEHGFTDEGACITQTPSGGRHVIFRDPTGGRIGNRDSMLPDSIDVRGNGGYIIAPPSKNGDGTYTWVEQNHPPALAPSALVDLLLSKPKAERKREARDAKTRVASGRDKYVEKAVKDEIDCLSSTAKGRRNNQLNKSAFNLGQLVPSGLLPQNRAETELYDACLVNGLVQDDGEPSVRATIDSGLRAGMALPRDIPANAVESSRTFARAAIETIDRLASLVDLGRTAEYFAQHDPPQVSWLIDGVLESNGMAMMYGDSGIGKTFLAMHMAYCIGAGKRWFNRKSQRSRVLYLDGENGEGLMHRRSKMIDPDGEADVIYYSFPDLSLDVDGILLTCALVRKMDADVVIIDPLMNFMQGDENAIEDIRPQISGLRAMADQEDCAIVLIHHENRGGTYRGSSGFKDLVTLQLHFVRSETNVSGFPHVLDVHPNKQRQSTLSRFAMVWRVVDNEFTAGEVAMIENGPRAKIVNAVERLREDNGEWPGKTELIRAKDQHGLSRRDATEALDAALRENDLKPFQASHNKTEIRVAKQGTS